MLARKVNTMNEQNINLKNKMAKQTKVIPLGDRVLVKLDDISEGKVSAAGIIIPETVDKEKPEMGEIIATGEGKRLDDGKVIPMKLKVGDTILFSKYGPDEVKINGEKYYIIREDAILAIVK
jgi:chaperonin GroES